VFAGMALCRQHLLQSGKHRQDELSELRLELKRPAGIALCDLVPGGFHLGGLALNEARDCATALQRSPCWRFPHACRREGSLHHLTILRSSRSGSTPQASANAMRSVTVTLRRPRSTLAT